jgi:small conductance mechanosensitive channel
VIPAALSGSGLTVPDTTTLVFVGVGLVVFLAFVIASRVVARFAAEQLRKRNVRADMVVLGRRVVTFVVIVIGLLAAFGFALKSADLPILGILVATVVAAFGVQDLLKDYVSGYYVLLERHFRVGDRISLEGAGSGTVREVRLRVTLLQTDAGDLVVVPNSELFGKAVTVHGHGADRTQEATPAPPG